MLTYLFMRKEPMPLAQVVHVLLGGEEIAQLPLHDKITRGFTIKCLEDWLGKSNAANIAVHGEVVLLTREKPIAFDFERFKKE